METNILKEYNWLVFGGGAVVTEYYLPAFEYMGLLDRVTIIEPNGTSISRIRDTWSINIIQKSYQDFLKEYNPDSDKTVAIIALPNFLHHEASKICLEKKIKVLCEKPLALKSSEIDDLIETEKMTGTSLTVGMVRRYLPTFSTLKNIIDSNKFGQVKSVEISYGSPFGWVADSYAFFDPKNGGVLADMGIHYLDLAIFLLGKIVPVSYTDDWSGGVEANAKMNLETESGKIPVGITLSRTRKLKNTFEVKTADCVISIGSDIFDKIEISANNSKYFINPVSPFSFSEDLPLIFESAFVEQLWNVVSFFEGNKNANVVSAETGKSGVQLIEWAYHHHKKTLEIAEQNTNYYITGGTGFIGSALIKHIYENKLGKVTAPVHRYKSCSPIAVYPVSIPRLNLFDEEQLYQQIKGHRHVIHLAYDNTGSNDFQVNVAGTQNVVNACIRAEVESVLILSSMYVYGHPETDEYVDEKWPLKPAGGDYGKSKAQMQRWCLERAKTMKTTRLVVLNPSCVFGPEGKTYSRLPFELYLNGRFCWVNNGTGTANTVYIDNLIDAMLLATKAKNAHGKNYIISDHTADWKTFITPLLIGNADRIVNRDINELINPKIQNRSTTKEIINFLLGNYDFISLINRHVLFGKIKKTVFKISSKLKKGLINQRNNSSTSSPLRKKEERIPDFPIWLNDLYGPTKTRFSSALAEKELGWIPKVSHTIAISKTADWLKEEFHVDEKS